jgi:3-oxoacyl-[acyl-carrier protein] reductase
VPLSLEGEAAYVASKAAVEALTKVAAKELAPSGVVVTAVGFGPIDTKLTRAVPKAALAKINNAISRPEGTTMSQAVDFILAHFRSAPAGKVEHLGQT